MAEDRYIRIATEIWEALTRLRIPGECRQVLDYIIRQTSGFQRKSDKISLSQFTEATGIQKPHVCRAIERLKRMSVVIVIKDGNRKAAEYSLNLDYSCWRPTHKKTNNDKSLPKEAKNVPPKANEGVFQKEENSSSEVIPETDITEETRGEKNWW